jgi:putative FmdB family regulatory protein
MPIFEYDCRKCGKAFDVLHTSKTTSVKCPNCSSEDVKKKISACGSITSACSINKSGGSGHG